jgi:hypothetical protein
MATDRLDAIRRMHGPAAERYAQTMKPLLQGLVVSAMQEHVGREVYDFRALAQSIAEGIERAYLDGALAESDRAFVEARRRK